LWRCQLLLLLLLLLLLQHQLLGATTELECDDCC
jgi:hypothetical protein